MRLRFPFMSIFYAILVGACSGLLGALCGVGGGIVMVPAFVYLLQLDQKTAVATSLAVIVSIALVATFKNAQSQLVDWRVFAATASGAMVAAYFGSDLMKHLSNAQLTRIFGTVLIVFGVQMLLRKS